MYRVITQDFGWKCPAYEFHSEKYVGSTENGCLKEVDGSDLYIGVFWKRAGSSIPHDNLHITELEYYRARKSRKPMRIYVVGADAESVDANLDHFITTIMEPDNGQCIQFCKDFSELVSKFKKDLDYFGECWVKGETAYWTPSFLTDKILRHLSFLTDHPELYHLPRRGALVASGPVDVGQLRQSISTMQKHYERAEFYKAGAAGSQLLLTFLKAGISFEKKELLPSWAEFLRMWAGTCTWLNLLNIPYGAVWAARVLRETYEAQEQWPSFNDSASLISHTYYVQACSLYDEKLSLSTAPKGKKRFQKERREIFRLQMGLEEERQKSLKKALAYDKLFLARSTPPDLYLYRAYIYQVMGDYDQAILDFERLAYHRSHAANEINYIDTIADLGGTKVLKAVNDKISKSAKSKLLNDGLRLLREAHEKAQSYTAARWLPWYIIVEKEYAKGFLLSGDKETAGILLNRLHRMAMKEGLSQQAGSIRILLEKSQSHV
jgi:tetratricopeptide (TPR) repeat protein